MEGRSLRIALRSRSVADLPQQNGNYEDQQGSRQLDQPSGGIGTT
jgi:hypothetical protein